ncbi:transglycosylase SLT domain-containing protein [Shewanella fidelis]|uniref:Transglycosylase SLT domain-containing protein n=1 Tax=Shewanella fidelis TaxID=173509 RepID=A0AAW8NLG6_9GAMM|nr:transglycosylase SLT domain-containing protein [Shewanella fidelis]MDR8524078.1 transglycosylase SLT domain-containing protein [Shewanella fidelis]MDW4810625.1 transglycosylase SLT domain-containing protein [Shewanella fidelis]MDW4814746.1 transglycosylase SLT domain-containing protein [Shewanella fidelis]MDW4818836.1 transglycosylase SLT domain-containing protein [Shewanella fidelis]MDW4823487.1 transglycosylase SLT domain-containing protein [Shewanella fidelis]
MHKQLSRILIGMLTLGISWSVAASSLTDEQQLYLDARSKLKKQHLSQYQVMRNKLDDYPLAIYLDFHNNINDILKLPGDKALAALEPFAGSPLYNTGRYRYLKRSGSQKRWQDFLSVSPNQPNNVVLQCYYYRAQLQKGDSKLAYEGAEKLWLHGRSRPKECDPLFRQWQKAGLRTQELIWSRMLLSFEQGQYGLLSYLSRQLTTNKDDAKRLLAVYKDPRSLRHKSKFSGSAKINATIVDLGLRKLAKKDLKQAVKLFSAYQKADRFSDYQGRKLNRYLVRRTLIYQVIELQSYADTILPLLDSDDLVEMRLRWALRDNDKQSFAKFLPQLSQQKQNTARWKYWRAQVLARENNQQSQQQSQRLFDELRLERNFYGYLAAEKLKKPFQLQDHTSESRPELKAKLFEDKGLARVRELLAIDKQSDARAEWVMLLKRHDKAMQTEYGVYAVSQNWHSLGVQASIQAKLWNDMQMRFPYAAQAAFTQASKKYAVNIDEIRAISRRESAYYPNATSGVGARGYMQLMPATAKQTAKKAKLPYRGIKSLYDEKLNIALGSAYYGSLLKQFDQNRVLATASYNAGPHRINSWLKRSDGKLDAISFIESIPYRETREYVQAVFSYKVIYQVRQGKQAELLSAKELNFNY